MECQELDVRARCCIFATKALLVFGFFWGTALLTVEVYTQLIYSNKCLFLYFSPPCNRVPKPPQFNEAFYEENNCLFEFPNEADHNTVCIE